MTSIISKLTLVSLFILLYTSFTKIFSKNFYYIIYFISFVVLFIMGTITVISHTVALTFTLNFGISILVSFVSQTCILQTISALNIIREQNEKVALQEQVLENTKKIMHEQKTLTTSYSRFVPHKFITLLKKEDIREIQVGDHARKTLSVFPFYT